jgi:glycosyltransferase involved in cell wall biosynthesis
LSGVRRLRTLFDDFRLRVHKPKLHHEFLIVTAAYNAETFVRKHLASTSGQKYPKERYRHLIIDDASTDATGDIVQDVARNSSNVDYVRNTERRGGCANLTRAFRDADPGSIVLQVDGDDWLPDPHVLSYLNLLYQDPELWMTYNTWSFSDGRAALNSSPIPEHVVSARSYRDEAWTSSHLHSFRAKLFRHVREESLIDPETGDYFHSAVDMAHYFPMLELSGAHARHVERVLYVYNLHSGSIENNQREKQLGCERRIRSLERYGPLASLDGSPDEDARSQSKSVMPADK